MGLELIKKEIDGHRYEFEQFGARQSSVLFIELVKKIGPSFTALFGEISKAPTKEDAKKLSSSAIGEAVRALLMNIGDAGETVALIEKFIAEKTLCDGKKINFDSHYQGRLFHQGKVLFAALEVQYGNFFEDVTALLAFTQAPTIPENPA